MDRLLPSCPAASSTLAGVQLSMINLATWIGVTDYIVDLLRSCWTVSGCFTTKCFAWLLLLFGYELWSLWGEEGGEELTAAVYDEMARRVPLALFHPEWPIPGFVTSVRWFVSDLTEFQLWG